MKTGFKMQGRFNSALHKTLKVLEKRVKQTYNYTQII